MAYFRYKAKDSSGRTIEGVTEATDVSAVVAELRKAGHFVLDVRETRGPREKQALDLSPGRMFQRWVINPMFAGSSVYQLAIFFRQLSTMVKSGMSIVQAMISLRTQGVNNRLKRIADETVVHIQEGGTLSSSFAGYPWMFSELQISLIRAGEAGGTLDVMLERIADYLDREHQVRQRLRMSTLYPKILVLAVIFIPALPVLILEGFKPYLAATLGILIPVLIGLAVLWAAYRLVYQIPSVRYTIDCVKVATPKLGKMVRMLGLAKFYRVFAAMTAAGAPVSQTFLHAANATGNWYLSTRLKTAIPSVEKGGRITDALRQTGVLPQMAIDMIATGEQTGSLDDMLDKAAEYTENEAEVAVMQSTLILGVLLLLCVAAYIGWFVVQSYMTQYLGPLQEQMD